jgi:hypothetical protein
LQQSWGSFKEADNGLIHLVDNPRRFSSDLVRIRWIQLLDSSSNPSRVFNFGEPLHIRVGFEARENMKLGVGVMLKSVTGEPITFFHTSHFHNHTVNANGPENVVHLVIPALPLAHGRYILDVGVGIPMIAWLDYVTEACFFDVEVSDPGDVGYSFRQSDGLGSVYINHYWQIAS